MAMSIYAVLLLACFTVTCNCTALHCMNGGTYDDVRLECRCTQYFYGRLCEHSFASNDPCDNITSQRTISDPKGIYRVGNTAVCSGSDCINFNLIEYAWYKFNSPAGDYLISQYSCLNSTINCGSARPHILHDVTSENNQNRPLFSAKLYEHDSRFPNCYHPYGNYYNVRILDCTSVKLYYLSPTMSSSHHFCIGDKKKCASDEISSDGSGYAPCYANASCVPQLNTAAPKPKLTLEPIKESDTNRDFSCQVFDSFTSNKSLIYRVTFHLRYLNGTVRDVSKCSVNNQTIPTAGSKTFSCRAPDPLFERGENVYGGTLYCSVQARCGADTYKSSIIISNVHRFEFDYRLTSNNSIDGATVREITPDSYVMMCISVADIPFDGSVNFSVSVGRRGIIPSDKIAVLVKPEYTNGTSNCEYTLGSYRGKSLICFNIMLNNGDYDGWIPTGLTPGQQVSELLVNVSYASVSNGLNTMNGVGRPQRVKLQERSLIVNLQSLYPVSHPSIGFLHVYNDPYVKPADSSYKQNFYHHIDSGYFTLLRHSILPYEVQVRVAPHKKLENAVVQVAVRYGYYIITVYGNAANNEVSCDVTPRLPAGVTKNPIPMKADGVPLGVTIIRKDTFGVLIRFDLYGTSILVWNFNLFHTNCPIYHFMSSETLSNSDCSIESQRQYDAEDNQIMFDVIVRPGFYDTRKMVDGWIYTTQADADRHELLISDTSNMFNPSYSMPRISDSLREIQPTQLIDLCSCDGETIEEDTCLVNAKKADRTRREAPPVSEQSSQSNTNSTFIPTRRNVTEQEADSVCNDLLQQKLSNSRALHLCRNYTGLGDTDDYMTQFVTVCKQYATTLGTFAYTENLFGDFGGECSSAMEHDVPTVVHKPMQIVQVKAESCAANCSGNGECVSGRCSCKPGFIGVACNVQLNSTQPITVHRQLSTDTLCAITQCGSVVFEVKPMLKSDIASCQFRAVTPGIRRNFTKQADVIGVRSLMCSVSDISDWLRDQKKMHLAVELTISGPDWLSINSTKLLVHQPIFDGHLTECDVSKMECRKGAAVVADLGNNSAASSLPSTTTAKPLIVTGQAQSTSTTSEASTVHVPASTANPSTQARSTANPSTDARSTANPSTQARSTANPSTQARSTANPSTHARSTANPSTQAKSTAYLSTQAKSTAYLSTQAGTRTRPFLLSTATTDTKYLSIGSGASLLKMNSPLLFLTLALLLLLYSAGSEK